MSKPFMVTREVLYRAACTQGNGPCAAHKDSVDKMIERLERMAEEEER
jgi:hypothetical protein